MTKLDKLTKAELLEALEHVDQHFWPPTPTRQDTGTIRDAIRRAQNAGRVRGSLADVIHGAIKERQQRLHLRRLAYRAANAKWPLESA